MEENHCVSRVKYNFSNEIVAESMLYKHFDRVNMLGILPCIIITGVLSNWAFLFTVFRLKRMQTVTNYYLAALATCDLTLLTTGPLLRVISFAQAVGRLFELSILRTRYHCACLFALAALAYYTSLAVLSLVSTERFYAICFPLRHRVIAGKGRTLKLILGALGVCFIFAAVNSTSLAGFMSFCVIWPNTDKYADMPTKGTRCIPLTYNFYVYHEVFNVMLFITVLIYNIVLYLMIVFALSSRSLVTKSTDLDIRNQVARVLILNGIVYFTCQGPYRLIVLNRVTTALFSFSFFSREQSANIETIGRILLYLNSAINPTLYALSSRFYRQAFMEALGISSLCRPSDISKSNVTALSTTGMPSTAAHNDMTEKFEENNI